MFYSFYEYNSTNYHIDWHNSKNLPVRASPFFWMISKKLRFARIYTYIYSETTVLNLFFWTFFKVELNLVYFYWNFLPSPHAAFIEWPSKRTQNFKEIGSSNCYIFVSQKSKLLICNIFPERPLKDIKMYTKKLKLKLKLNYYKMHYIYNVPMTHSNLKAKELVQGFITWLQRTDWYVYECIILVGTSGLV